MRRRQSTTPTAPTEPTPDPTTAGPLARTVATVRGWVGRPSTTDAPSDSEVLTLLLDMMSDVHRDVSALKRDVYLLSLEHGSIEMQLSEPRVDV